MINLSTRSRQAHYVRSERSGTGLGRVYTLTYETKDAAGNTRRQTVEVHVGHDRSRLRR